MTGKKEKSFEASLAELEKIVEALESGDLPLEKALEKFEAGVKLSEACARKLNDAEKKISLLVKNQDGNYVHHPFPENREEDTAD